MVARRMFQAIRRRLKPALSPVARSVSAEGLTYLSTDKLKRLEAALKAVQGVPGDFAEFGVALGGSAIVVAKRAKGRRFHGFDVFGMIPEPSSPKDDDKSKARYETIRSGNSSGIDGRTYYGYRPDLYEEVRASLSRYGVTNALLHRGLFEETVPAAGIEALAFAHIDCDWYDPVSFCLDAVAEKLSPGGAIVIDDYHDYGGCRTAVDEFLATHPEFVFEDGPNPILRYRVKQ